MESAEKHYPIADGLHALRHRVGFVERFDVDSDGGAVVDLVIGPARDGQMLEVFVQPTRPADGVRHPRTAPSAEDAGPSAADRPGTHEGITMTKQVTPAEQARYSVLAARTEQVNFGPIDVETGSGAEFDLDALLEGIEADQSTPTPQPAPGVESVTAAETRARLGRPGLTGDTGAGRSPKRQVRLPRDLDQLLDQRAAELHRTPSDLMRDAIDRYLHAS